MVLPFEYTPWMAPPLLTLNDFSEPANAPSCFTTPTVLAPPNCVIRLVEPALPSWNVTAAVTPGIWPAAASIVKSAGAVISPSLPKVSTLSVSAIAVAGVPWLALTVHWLAAVFLYTRFTWIVAPWSVYAVNELVTSVFNAAAAERLPEMVTSDVCVGGSALPIGTLIRVSAPAVLITPLASACQPITNPPSVVARLPDESSERAPPRVYNRSVPLSITKKPSPSIAMSVLRPVRCSAPWLNVCVVAASRAPRPTWDGLVPATTPFGSPAVSVWLSTSENTTFDALKPDVETLEMSFEITSSMS